MDELIQTNKPHLPTRNSTKLFRTNTVSHELRIWLPGEEGKVKASKMQLQPPVRQTRHFLRQADVKVGERCEGGGGAGGRLVVQPEPHCAHTRPRPRAPLSPNLAGLPKSKHK